MYSHELKSASSMIQNPGPCEKKSGPSCSKHHSLIELISGQNFSCSCIKAQYLINRYFCWKNVSSFCKCKSYSHFLSKNNSVYATFYDQNLNGMLTNDIISFEKLGPWVLTTSPCKSSNTIYHGMSRNNHFAKLIFMDASIQIHRLNILAVLTYLSQTCF